MEYGKFASAEELLKGYNELEKSFTQKCQQLSALEKSISQPTAEECGTSVETPPQEGELSTTVDSAATVPQTVEDATAVQRGEAQPSFTPTEKELQQYLENNPQVALKILQQSKTENPPVMSGGGNVSLALPSRPKTLKEASLMAKELFK